MTELPNPRTDRTDPSLPEPGGETPAGPSPIDGARRDDSTLEPTQAATSASGGPVGASDERALVAGPETKRLDRRARRTQAAALRDASFDWLAKGFTHQEIAAARKVSLAVVRRDVARAIRARQIESRDGHAQLQIARLTQGLAVVTHRIEKGDMAAVGPLVKLVTALDRYHRPGGAPAEPPRARLASRRLSSALAAPPLAIGHVAAPEPKAQNAAVDACDASGAAFGERLDSQALATCPPDRTN